MAPQATSAGSRSRSRYLRRAAMIASVALFVLSLVAGVHSSRGRRMAELDARLQASVAERSAAAQEYFDRARSLILLLAQNPSFSRLYADSSRRDLELTTGGNEIAEARKAIAYLQRLYSGKINEICFIDRGGAENARVVREHQASNSELSSDESGNSFFSPTFQLAPGEVYQAAPYNSPDTFDWVISNSTPVATEDGVPAIVHFEVTVESFRELLIDPTHAIDANIVDANTGAVIADTTIAQQQGGPLGRPSDERFAILAGASAARGMLTIDGRRFSYRRLTVAAHNVNDWYIVVSAPLPAGSVISGLSAGTFSLLGAALLLALVGLISARSHQRRLSDAALSDSLTGLPNRNMLIERASQALAAARRNGGRVGLLLLDLDKFKEINDTLGHQWGDRLLQAIGPRIAPVIRQSDLIARLGGDEFVILLGDVADDAAAHRVAERVLALLEQPFQLGELACGIEASIGIAIGPRDGDDVHALFQHADVAMYVAKQNQLGAAMYEPELDRHNPRKLSMLGELRLAIERKELVLYYQPKNSLPYGERRGVEALVRWMHPERGLIPPDDFIPLAEHTALITPLTSYVLDAALAQCRAWMDDGHEVCVAINVSARSLHDTYFYDLVESKLVEHGVPSHLLELEITETAIMADPKRARDLLMRLHELGVQLAIDDFGTGYSSLAYLKTLPVHALKIDRSFVMNLQHDQGDAVIVRSVIDLGRNLGLRVVAEGVENEETSDYLARAGCTVAQGYLWSRPVPPEQLAEWLTRPAPDAVERDALTPS